MFREKKKIVFEWAPSVMGRILAAEYDIPTSLSSVLFHDATGSPGYFRPDGGALQKAFLRSPLKFARL